MENKLQTGLGEYLRGERERRHITIEQVASATKINIKLLHALESDNYDILPAKPFVRGFVTSYTRYVGLDYREVLARFDPFLDEKSGQKFRRPENTPHIFVEREGSAESSKMWLSIGMVSFIVAGVLVFVILKPSLRHRHGRGKDKAAVSNEELMTVMPPPIDGSQSPTETQPKTPNPNADTGARKAETTLPSAAEAVSSAESPRPTPPTVSTAANTDAPILPAPPIAVATPVPAIPPVLAKAPVVVELPKGPQGKPAAKVEKPQPKATAAAVAKTQPEKPKPEKPKAEKPKPEATPEVAAAKAPPPKIPPIPSNEVKYRIVVHALDDAWVKYQVDDRPVQQYTLKKDKTIWVRARESIRFQTPKPNVLEISRDNREFHPMDPKSRTLILPKEAEGQFKTAPFVPPNPAYLSTPNQ